MKIHPLCLMALPLMAGALPTPAEGHFVYLKSGDSPFFARYDTTTNAWTTLTGFDADSQLTTDANGELYAIHSGWGVRKYLPTTDSWTTVAPVPVTGLDYDNLEIANDGSLLLTVLGDDDVYRYASGSWTSVTVDQFLGNPGDYDHATGTFAVAHASQSAFSVIDFSTGAETKYTTGSVSQAEHRRLGELLEGRFYVSGTTAGGFLSYDLSNPSAGPTTEAALPSGVNAFPAGVADPTTGTLFLASIGSGGGFYRYDPDTQVYTPLAGFPSSSYSYHNSLAFVAIPEPGVLGLLGVSSLTLLRRHRCRG